MTLAPAACGITPLQCSQAPPWQTFVTFRPVCDDKYVGTVRKEALAKKSPDKSRPRRTMLEIPLFCAAPSVIVIGSLDSA